MRWLPVLLIVMLALAIRWEYQRSSDISHDEVISILTAQGNISAYKNALAAKTDRWVPAVEWKIYFAKTSDRSLREIARDLASGDIHPPLYFWLLRGWLQLFDPNFAKALNLLTLCLAGTALFQLARTSCGTTTAVVAVSIWLLSPQTIRVSVFVRQYELLALLAILLALQTLRIAAGNTSRLNLAIFAAIALLGLLTQYLFALILVTAIYVVLRAKPATGGWLAMFLVAAVGIFLVLHPYFYRQIGAYSGAGGFVDRMQIIASSLLGFFAWRESWTTVPLRRS